MRLKTDRLILRDIRVEDLDDLISGLNNINVSGRLARVPYPYTIKDAKWWISKCEEEAKKKPRTEYNFFIELTEESRLIGSADFADVNKFNGTATLGYWLNQNYWRRGIMQEAVTRVIDYGFNSIKLRRINVSAFVDNDGSNGLIKKLGFNYEGMRKAFHRSMSDGKLHDENIYGLLKKDWKRK